MEQLTQSIPSNLAQVQLFVTRFEKVRIGQGQ